MSAKGITPDQIDSLCARLQAEAQESGYFLNPDEAFTRDLVQSLIINDQRYGYPSCPCRLASGEKVDDLDIVCPCDYRDPDLAEHGACFCALYVGQAIARGERQVAPVPERRLDRERRETSRQDRSPGEKTDLPYPIWRCRVCGYLCARDEPPDTCPICKVKKERFERFM